MSEAKTGEELPNFLTVVSQFDLYEGEVLHLESEAAEPKPRCIYSTDEPGEYALIRLGGTDHD